MSVLSIHLFGQFSIDLDGNSIETRSQPSQSLLAYLLLNRHSTHRREKVAGILWPDSDESNARSNLRHALYKLKKSLGDEFFESNRSTLAFNTDSSFKLDVQLLEDPANETGPIDELLNSVAVYKGELLPGFYDDWVELERERLQAVFDRKIHLLLEGLIEAERWDDCLVWAERWIAMGQTPEPAYRALMLAHNRQGDSARMATAYQRTIDDLAEGLGVEPSTETRVLFEQLSEGTPRRIEIRPAAQHNLPAQVTSFIGREQQLSELSDLLKKEDIRLVTLTGPGGIGKTRLGVQVAHTLLGEFEDGIHFVNLVPIRNADLVIPTIAASLGLAESADEEVLKTLANFMESKDLLLFLDNFEQVIEATADVAALLSGAPGLKLLITSREGLRVYGETEYEVPPLGVSSSVSDPEIIINSEAMDLFVERARSIRPRFELTTENARQIREICARLDNLPLAIELAAARTKLYNPQALLAELERSFDALEVRVRAGDEKKRTLNATIGWSYDLLEDHEKSLFARLSIFRGGHTIEAAQAVCQVEDSFDLADLESLHNKSLIIQREGPLGEPRFGMLETIHEYAAERLAESGQHATIQRNHAIYFTEFAEQAEPKLRGPEQADWFRLLEVEYDNFKVVLQWSLMGGDSEFGLRLTGTLRDYWYYQGQSIEGMYWVAQAMEHLEDASPVLQGKVLNTAGHMFTLHSRNLEEARSFQRQALAIYRQLDDKSLIAWSLIWLSYSHLDQPEKYEEAMSYCDEALALFRELEDEIGVTQTLNVVGELARVHGDLDLAWNAYEESLALCRSTGDQRRESIMLLNLGYVAGLNNNYDQAEALIRESLNLAIAIDHNYMIAANLAAFVGVFAASGEPLQAAKLTGAAATAMENRGTGSQPADQVELDRYEASVRQQLSEEDYESAFAAGRAMNKDEAIRLALNFD